MNLQPMRPTPAPGSRVHCASCGAAVPAASVLCDLDGRFGDWYCSPGCAPLRDPDNVRNRWRRMCAARRAYGFAGAPTLRLFATRYPPTAYAAGPDDRRVTFRNLLRAAGRTP